MKMSKLDATVLRAIYELGGGAYPTLDIKDRVSELLGRKHWWNQVSTGSFWEALRSLEEKGYVGWHPTEATAVRGWRKGRAYFLTVTGIVAVEKIRDVS
jgi:hypothetical protein